MTNDVHARPQTTVKAVTWTWIVLAGIAIGSWWLAPAHSGDTVVPSTAITALALVLTFVKSRLIIRYFMEVRTAPRWLKLATDGWLAALFLTIVASYLS